MVYRIVVIIICGFGFLFLGLEREAVSETVNLQIDSTLEGYYTSQTPLFKAIQSIYHYWLGKFKQFYSLFLIILYFILSLISLKLLLPRFPSFKLLLGGYIMIGSASIILIIISGKFYEIEAIRSTAVEIIHFLQSPIPVALIAIPVLILRKKNKS